jgi:O-antigen/teichoic acid export membrane protein
MSTNRRILSGTAISLGAQVIGYILYFFAIRAILSGLSKEENGELFGIQRIAEFIIALGVEAGMNTVVLRKLVQNEADSDAILATFAKMRFMLWLAASSVLAIVGWIFMPEHIGLLLVWSLYSLLSAKSVLWRFVFELRYRARTNLLPVYLLGLLDTVLFLAVIYFIPRPLTAEYIITGFCISALPGFLVLLILTGDWRLVKTPFSKAIATDIFKSSMPVMLSFLLMQIHDKSDAFFLQYFWGEAELGIFGAVYRVLPPLVAVSFTLTTVLTPSIAKFHIEDIERSKRFIFGGIKILLYFGGLISVTMSASTGFIIQVLTDGVYADSFWQFFIFLWLPLPIYIIIFLFDVNIVLGHERNNFYITATEAGLSVVTNLFLTPLYASLGTVFSKLFTLIISTGVALWLLRDFLKGFGVITFFVRFFIAASGGFGCAILLPMVMPQIAASVVGAGIYCGLLYITGAISQEDIAMAKQFLKKG